MKKSLIALAVAGAFAAPAFAATSNVDVYGVLNIAIQDTNAVGNDFAVVDNVSRIGFKGTEDLGGGLKAIWQIESALSATPSESGNGVGGTTGAHAASAVDTGASGLLATRNTFVGLAGGFGTVLMGRHDTPYKLGTLSLDIFGDTVGDYNGGGAGVLGARLGNDTLLANAHDARSPQAFAYISPTWSGFHFAVAGIATNTAANGDSGDSIDGVSATGVYINGPIFLSLSYQNVDKATNFLGSTTLEAVDGLLYTGIPAQSVTSTAGKSTAWKLGGSYSFGDAKVGLIYESVKVDAIMLGDSIANGNVPGGLDLKRTTWLLNGAYTMGPIVLKAQYGKVNYGSDFNGVDDSTGYALGVDYNVSKRTTAYIAYASMDNDTLQAKRASGYNIGMKHSF